MIKLDIGLNAKPWAAGISSVMGASGRAVASIGNQWRSLALSYLGAKGIQMLARTAAEWNELATQANLSADTMARIEQAARAAGVTLKDIQPLFADLIDEQTRKRMEDFARQADSVSASVENIAKHSAWMKAGLLFKSIGQKVSDLSGRALSAIFDLMPSSMRMSLLQGAGGGSVNMQDLVSKYTNKERAGGAGIGSSFGMGLNPLQQIGGFARGPTDRMVNHLRNIEANTKTTASALSQRNAGIGAIGF